MARRAQWTIDDGRSTMDDRRWTIDDGRSTSLCGTLPVVMRVVGIDLGERRIGIAVSDATATLARPLRTIQRQGSDESAASDLLEVVRGLNDEDEVGCVVIGLPTSLDG